MILLDTHVVIWLVSEPDKLSRDARAAIRECRERGDALAIVDITLLELAGLARRHRIQIASDAPDLLDYVQSLFEIRPITARACKRTLELPPAYPKDPADRIIGATALEEGYQLITADESILRSNAVDTIW